MRIEEHILEEDIPTFYVSSDSFPGGVLKAHQTLRGLLPDVRERNFYGISRPNEKGVIVYHAAVKENFAGEGNKYNCKALTLKKGKYISIVLEDYMKNMEDFGKAFDLLLKDKRIDTTGYCVEDYLSDKNVRCMVRLRNN